MTRYSTSCTSDSSFMLGWNTVKLSNLTDISPGSPSPGCSTRSRGTWWRRTSSASPPRRSGSSGAPRRRPRKPVGFLVSVAARTDETLRKQFQFLDRIKSEKTVKKIFRYLKYLISFCLLWVSFTGWHIRLCKTSRWQQSESYKDLILKRKFQINVNGRFCTLWCVTLYLSVYKEV